MWPQLGRRNGWRATAPFANRPATALLSNLARAGQPGESAERPLAQREKCYEALRAHREDDLLVALSKRNPRAALTGAPDQISAFATETPSVRRIAIPMEPQSLDG